MHITLNVLADYELLFNVDTCDEGHSVGKIQRMFVWSSTNYVLNNCCLRENNITSNKLSKKIKTSNIHLNFVCVTYFSISILFFKSIYCLFVSNLFACLYFIYFLIHNSVVAVFE